MNFFDAQDKARRATRWLVVVYVAATLLIVAGVTAVVAATFYSLGQQAGTTAPPALLGATAILATLFIVGATLYKTARLSSGGGRVARDLGGTPVAPDVRDPLRRRLRNVVEEMAIASGVPVPEIYVLEEENGINAFAAGYSPGDAAIAVTRGCLELLDRDELQGVIAHEFSHVLNGDMRLNIRMMGVLFGIMVLGIIGRMVLRGAYHRSLWSSRRSKNASVVVLVGLGLTVLGWVGVFMARLIKAAVSRQREFLADASAVQFTRQTDGIANALKKIGGFSGKSYITRADPEEVSHMLFAGGVKRFAAMFATHPPLVDRIRALDPQFTENDYPDVDARGRVTAEPERISGFSQSENAMLQAAKHRGNADTIAGTVGQPQPQHVQFARKLRSSIPPVLYAAAHAPDEALLLAIALGMSTDDDQSNRQLSLIGQKIGDERAEVVHGFLSAIRRAGQLYRLPLLEIAFPALKNRPEPQIEFLLGLVKALIQLDGKIGLGEYCYYRVLRSHLIESIDPTAANRGNRVAKKAAQRAAVQLLRVVADAAGSDGESRNGAFAAGIRAFGGWADSYAADRHDDTSANSRGLGSVAVLDECLDVLARINSAGRQSLLRAVSEAVTHDSTLNVREAELLRAICAVLHCPLPPILTDPIPANSS